MVGACEQIAMSMRGGPIGHYHYAGYGYISYLLDWGPAGILALAWSFTVVAEWKLQPGSEVRANQLSYRRQGHQVCQRKTLFTENGGMAIVDSVIIVGWILAG